jgi:hypothetical protein
MNEGADSLAGSGEAPVQRQGARSTTGRTSARKAALAGALLCAACTSPDPAALFSVSAVETHWAVDPSVGDTQYVAPVVRLKLHNKSEQAQTSVQATAVFRHKGEPDQTWGSDYTQVATRQKPISPGQEIALMLKSDARYSARNEAPEAMLANAAFKDATVDVFVRVGSSAWMKFASVEVERRIGSRVAQQIVSTPADGPPIPVPSPSASTVPSPAASPVRRP